ncbi:PAS domain S-box protein [Pedobacter xixiisoli]|uniref:histidine kinase n=1 Tax=Pedobacter xixiisoli TaxID=1476464 RepID=A0A286AEM8_9SPHI|nr:PAS domain S-box protein [Pedobacter xixiisoli]SOD20352.1 PAS domain S-box-containing protein [Pedobacter xixiisoli]
MLNIPSPYYQMEEQRLAALYSYDVLGEGLESELDNLVKLAAQIASTKKAYISFVDQDHVVFKATYGLLTQERIFTREGSVCQYAMHGDIYIIPDIRISKDFEGSPLLYSQDNLVFYGSIPLVDTDGFPLGCLCVVDDCEGNLSSLQIEALQTLSLQIVAQLSLRRKNLQLIAQTKRSEEFINVFEASPEIHCILTRDGDILFTNQAANKLLGYSMEEILGKSMWSFCYRDDIIKITKHIEQGLIRGEKQFFLDFRVVDKAKRVKWLSWSMVAKEDRWYSYGRDITEKKRLDVELTHLSFVASKVNNGVVISDDYNRVSWANDAFTEITGFTLEDIQGKPLGDLIRGPETDWSVVEEARKLTSEKKSFTVDILAYRKDKTKIWLSIYSSIILSADGEVETEIEIILDITDKKKAEQELAVLSTVASKTNTGVSICNQDGEITWINEALEKLIGYSSAELSGKMLGDVLSTDQTDRQVILKARTASEHKQSFSIEVLAQKKNGTSIWLAVSNTPIVNSSGKVERYIELITDITERKQVERDILEAKEQALQLSEAKEMFLSVMSHEIRTPLNAIIGMTHLLIENDPKPSQTDDLNILKFSGENLLSIINDVLDFTKIETGNLHLEFLPVNLQLLCADIISSLQINATKQQNDLNLQFDGQIPSLVSADKTRLYQILMNLLGNAIKFTTKGRVDLIVKAQQEHTEKIDIYFEVKDNGIGIPSDKKDYIFETFTQARADISRKYGGTGLGLAITKKLLKLYQSEIKVDSLEGKGTSFSFVISFDKISQVETQKAFKPVVFEGKRVLVVDDNEINILIAKRILMKWGLSIDFAADGYKAIACITKNKYDLVFMDIKMPGITGFETTTIIRGMEEEHYKNLPIVALTASTLHDEESKFKESGMNGHVLKPFSPTEIKKVLSEFLI